MGDVKQYLSRVCSTGPLVEKWQNIQVQYEKRLWHELTESLLQLVKDEYFRTNGGLVELYENFLADFEHRINPLSLAELIVIIAQEIKDYDQAVALFEKTKEKVNSSTEAKILCMTSIGLLHLQAKKMDETKKMIKDTQNLLDTLDGVSTVHGRFYDLSSTYSKVTGSFNDYYRDALRLLGCIDISQLRESELQERAFNLSLSALLGNEIYNFGELLAHEVLEYLKNTEHSWLIEVLYAFNSGDILKFLEAKSSWSKQADLAANETALMQKITLLCLMEVAFNRKSNDRSFTFKHIAAETMLPENEVELLVMKALSLGLIKGTIDEVNQMVHITWVQPRVLDLKQIAKLLGRFATWTESIRMSEHIVEAEAPELLIN